jgi:hypothetical protein
VAGAIEFAFCSFQQREKTTRQRIEVFLGSDRSPTDKQAMDLNQQSRNLGSQHLGAKLFVAAELQGEIFESVPK